MPETPSQAPPGGAGTPSSPRRARVGILLAFLGAFLALLFLFREVLFPFLMAMFLAYLVEPVVAWFTKAPVFGIHWTRGPTIVTMYVILLGGIVLTASCAVGKVAGTVEGLSREVTRTLNEPAQRARFRLEPADGISKDLRIPQGIRVALRPHGPAAPAPAPEAPPPEPAPTRVFETIHEVLIHAGESEATVLLEAVKPPQEGGEPGRILNPEGIEFTDGSPLPAPGRLVVETAESASGLLVFVERNLVTPIVNSLERVGVRIEATELRVLIAAQARALGENLPQRVTRWAGDLAKGLVLGIYQFILILMLTAFIVMDRKAISRFFSSLPPDHRRAEYETLVRYVDRGLAGVIRGQLVICAVNGVLTYIGLVIFGIKWAEILALIAGVLSLIPIFGTIVSSIPIVLIAMTDGVDKGALALAWIAFIHLLEANLLNPLIMGTHARMHPVIIIFALLAGEHSFGVWGALLAVPTASIIQSCFQFYRHEIEGIPWEPHSPHGAWMRNLFRRIFRRGPPPQEGAPA
jgi:predicted PurR-regulated permease PerM